MKQVPDPENDLPRHAVKPSSASSSQVIDAVFEDGVFKPLKPLNLPPKTMIQLRVPVSLVSDEPASADQSFSGTRQMVIDPAGPITVSEPDTVRPKSSPSGQPLNFARLPWLPIILGVVILSVLGIIFLRNRGKDASVPDKAPEFSMPEIAAAPVAEGAQLPQPELVETFNIPSLPNGKNAVPRNIAIDSTGNLYVSTASDGLIRKYDRSGKMLLSWSCRQEDQPGDLADVVGDIVIGNNDVIHVLNAGTGTVYFYDTEGKEMRESVPIPGRYYPRGLALLPDNEIIIVNTGIGNVIRMRTDGTVVSEFGRAGSNPGEFKEAVDVVLNNKNEMYVYDVTNQRIQHLTLDGNLINQWRPAPIPGRDGGRLAIDSSGFLYEASMSNKEVVVYNPQGKIVGRWPQPDEDAPAGIYVDRQNHLYVTYPSSGNIRIFRISPQKSA